MFQGRWTSVGENFSIKHLSFLKCQIGQRRKLELTLKISPETGDDTNSYCWYHSFNSSYSFVLFLFNNILKTIFKKWGHSSSRTTKRRKWTRYECCEFAELIGQPFNDSNTSDSPTPSTSKEVDKT